jgi:uncharacterized protein (DUF58 family)
VTEAADLRSRAEELAAPLPPLLAAADHLASTVILGEHGRRRAGMGDEFWQYRAAQPGDESRMIDWRRSARSDTHYVREKEWQAAQSVLFWIDDSAAMEFRSKDALPSKSDRARLLALALSTLLVRGGERVGLTRLDMPARSGETQLLRMAETMGAMGHGAAGDYGAPDIRGIQPHSRAVFLSDFMGDIAAVEAAVTRATDRGVSGAILQVLDPEEEAFPFDGRTIFESMGRTMIHETKKARDLRDRYLERLAERKDRLAGLARATGWQFDTHHTDAPAAGALLWLYRSLERVQ